MPGVLKNLMARLKHRRKSKSRQNRTDNGSQSSASTEPGGNMTDQLASLSLTTSETAAMIDSDSNYTPSKSHVFGDADFEFEFHFPAVKQIWPGPPYDQYALFAPGSFDKPRHPKRRPPRKSSKRRVSHDECFVSLNPPNRLGNKPAKTIIRPKPAVPPKPQYYGQPPARDPPVHLLNLPGEIRNQIYRLLCVVDDPIAAQFRMIIKPKHGGKKNAEIQRRFPREPILSLVCRQLQREVLSIFYGENKFLFRKSDNTKFHGSSCFPPSMACWEHIEMWRPISPFADALTHLEVHFKAREPGLRSFHILYVFRKLVDGKCAISVEGCGTQCCTCFEAGVRRKAELAWIEPGGTDMDLVTLAVNTVRARQEAYRATPALKSTFPYSMWRPAKPRCDDCGLEHLTEVGSGV